MRRPVRDRVAAGVDIRVIGKTGKGLDAVLTRKLADLRLHARAIIRDGSRAFIGSQSLRKLELDARREIGVIINDPRIARRCARCSRRIGLKGDKASRARRSEEGRSRPRSGDHAPDQGRGRRRDARSRPSRRSARARDAALNVSWSPKISATRNA